MKKSIILATLGLASVAVSSFGDGYVNFSSYSANSGTGATLTYVDYYLNPPTIKLVDSGMGIEANLYYTFGTFSDPVDNTSASSIFSLPSAPLTLYTGPNNSPIYDNSGFATGPSGVGYFDGGIITIPGYQSGPITFEIVAFGGGMSARSGSFTMSSIATSGQPVTSLGDSGQPMPNFNIGTLEGILPTPEASSLALACFGGLISLIVLRSKRA